MINDAIDKRNHPIEAAKTATKLLRTNYRMLESWPLAVTGWNHGPNGILRMTKKYKTRELGEIADITKKKTFGFASKNFYSSFLAILEVEKNAFKYLGNVTWSQPLDSIEIKTPVALSYKELVSWFDGNDLKTQIFNPHINRVVRQGKMKITKGAVLSIPKNKYEEVIASLNSPERSTKVSDRKSNQSKTR
jgi:membrane-bound lytic murein transglycosylase D